MIYTARFPDGTDTHTHTHTHTTMPGFVVLLRSGKVAAVERAAENGSASTTLIAASAPAKPCDPRRPGILRGWADTVAVAASPTCVVAVNRAGVVRAIDRTTGHARHTKLSSDAPDTHQIPHAEAVGRIPIVAVAAPSAPPAPPLYRIWAFAPTAATGTATAGAHTPGLAHIQLTPPIHIAWMAAIAPAHLLVCTPSGFRVFAIDQESGNATEETVSQLTPMPSDARFDGYSASGEARIVLLHSALVLRRRPVKTAAHLHTWQFEEDQQQQHRRTAFPYAASSTEQWAVADDGAGAALAVCSPAGRYHVPWIATDKDAWTKLPHLPHPLAIAAMSP